MQEKSKTDFLFLKYWYSKSGNLGSPDTAFSEIKFRSINRAGSGMPLVFEWKSVIYSVVRYWLRLIDNYFKFLCSYITLSKI